MSVLIFKGGRKMGPARRYGLHVAGQLWYAAWSNRNRQLTRHAYPGQPSTRPQHAPPLCLCTYTLGPVLIDHPDGYDLVFTPHFVIAPECMHHGHLAHRDVVRRMWDDPYGYGLLRDPYDLDDDERKD